MKHLHQIRRPLSTGLLFTAEIAPKGKEGTYIALSILPWFAAKFIAGPMSGLLVKYYTPFEGGHPLPPADDYTMVWVWIGGLALLTPITLLALGKFFLRILVPTEDQAPTETETVEG